MKYLKKFETEANKSAWRETEEHVIPNVVLTDGVVSFNVPPIPRGVFIQHIDGTLYSLDEWATNGFANNQANGVAVSDKKASFVIAKNYIDTNIAWATSGDEVAGVLVATSSDIAKKDYNGEANTALIVEKNPSASGAVYKCANYTFPNGAKGYLPALGEWDIVENYKSEIEAALTAIGGNIIPSTETRWRYWSSTQGSTKSDAWYYVWNYNSYNYAFYSKPKTNAYQGTPGERYVCRAFTKLSF